MALCKKYDVVENKKGKRVIRNRDVIAEAFVEHFHLLLPNIQFVWNMNSKHFNTAKRRNSAAGPRNKEWKPIKLVELKK